MRWLHRTLAFLVLFSCQLNLVCPQQDKTYVREGSVGKHSQPKVSSKGLFPYRPIETWVGERFVFQQMAVWEIDLGSKTYPEIFEENEPSSILGTALYRKYAGRVAKVVAVTKKNGTWHVKLQLEDDSHMLTATTSSDYIDGLVPVADIDQARKMFIGKTLWLKDRRLSTYQKEDNTVSKFKVVKKYSPVNVLDVVASWDNVCLIRFILQASDGRQGFVDVNLSGTNSAGDSLKLADYLLTSNPRSTYRWPTKVWAAIESEKVFVGMTEAQVLMSWGAPDHINRTITGNLVREQWVYGRGSYLYLTRKILTAIQN